MISFLLFISYAFAVERLLAAQRLPVAPGVYPVAPQIRPARISEVVPAPGLGLMTPMIRDSKGKLIHDPDVEIVRDLEGNITLRRKIADAKAEDETTSTAVPSPSLSRSSSRSSSCSSASDKPEFLEGIYNANLLVKDHQVNKTSQEECKKFYDERNDTNGNFFGTTIIVDLMPESCDDSNKELAEGIKNFQKELREIKGSENFFDFQKNPHMTVSAVIMDRDLKKNSKEENKRFQNKTTNVSKIHEVMKDIEKRNVTVHVKQAESLKIANNKGQFSIQFSEAQEANESSDLGVEKVQEQIMKDLLNRFRNETDASNLKNLGERAGKAISELEKFKIKQPTEFQKVRFELMEKIGADTKDHYPAMALHIGQIKDPEALNEDPEALKEVNRIFKGYQEKFQMNKIVMKGLKYVQYSSTSLNPDMIQVL